jgi:phage shock protein C
MNKNQWNMLVGALLIVLGLIFLADNFDFLPRYLNMSKLWPVVLIIVGLYFIWSRMERK